MRKNKRKLICKVTLERIAKLTSLGVPLLRIIRDEDLNVSAPHVAKLVDYLKTGEYEASLFPPWLKGKVIAEQPEDWKYDGRFPWGKWINENNTAVH